MQNVFKINQNFIFKELINYCYVFDITRVFTLPHAGKNNINYIYYKK